MNTEHNPDQRDVVIIGGGAAGLSAALTLSRARRAVTVIDAGQPRNAPAAGAHGLLGREGINPFEFLAQGRREIQRYGAEFIEASVHTVEGQDGDFKVTLDDGDQVSARQLIIASGARDVLPDIEGLRARWGRDVVHCPYCHGWEIRDKPLAIIATSETSAYQAVLFQQWSNDITLLSQGIAFHTTARETLAAVGIPVIDTPVSALRISDDQLTGVQLDDGHILPAQAVGIASGLRANIESLKPLGLDTVTTPQGVFLDAADTGETNIAGVWAAGNVIDPDLQLAECASQGSRVAITLNNALIFSHAERARAAATQERPS